MSSVYLGLGTNMGDRVKNLKDALVMIEERLGNIDSKSGIYKTEPWGFNSDDYFLNMVVCLSVEASPHEVLRDLMSIEKSLGRVRVGAGFSSRIIDIDILFFDRIIIDNASLVIPHPLIAERMFVLRPLMDLAPDLIHPLLNRSIAELVNDCNDSLQVIRVDK